MQMQTSFLIISEGRLEPLWPIGGLLELDNPPQTGRILPINPLAVPCRGPEPVARVRGAAGADGRAELLLRDALRVVRDAWGAGLYIFHLDPSILQGCRAAGMIG